MLKKLSTLFLLVTIFLVSIFSSACNEPSILYFSNSFNDGNEATTDYYEKCTYKVNYSKTNEYFQFASNLNSNLTIDYDEGSYITELKVESALPNKTISGKDIETDLRETLQGKKVFHYTTKLNIPLKYKINGENEITHNEIMESEAYFCPQDMSFAPIISDNFFETSILLFSENSVNTFKSEYTYYYNLNTFSLKGTSSLSQGEDSSTTNYDRTKNYTFRSVIDNSEFMFVIRNMTIEEEKFGYLLDTALAYEEPKSLVINNKSTSAISMNFTYNQVEYDSINATSYNYAQNEKNNSGTSQYYFIQSEKSDTLPMKALLVKYIEPIIEYSSLNIVGSLIYTLSSVVIN